LRGIHSRARSGSHAFYRAYPQGAEVSVSKAVSANGLPITDVVAAIEPRLLDVVAAFDAVVARIAEIAQPIDALVASVASPPPPTSARVDSPEHILPAYVDINDDICWPPEVSAGSSPAAVADVTLEPDNSTHAMVEDPLVDECRDPVISLIGPLPTIPEVENDDDACRSPAFPENEEVDATCRPPATFTSAPPAALYQAQMITLLWQPVAALPLILMIRFLFYWPYPRLVSVYLQPPRPALA